MKGSSRSARGGKRNKSSRTGAVANDEPKVDGGHDDVALRVLEIALEGARKQARGLHGQQRALFTIALGGSLLVAIRGIAAVAFSRSAAPELAVALGAAIVLFAATFAWGWRIRGRLEHLLRDVQALDHTRAALTDGAPRVEVGPVRMDDGSERPVVVVRNDSMERLLLDGSSPTDGRSMWLGRAAWGAVGAIAVAVTGSLVLERDASAARRWPFVDPSEPVALGFRVVGERSGTWLVEEHSTATGAHALANRAGDQGSPPATLIAHAIQAKDLEAATRCKVTTDRDGSACGIVFRFQDDANHHLARLDFEQRRLVVSIVSSGVEQVLGAAPARIVPGTWQELRVEARGERLRASCNGRDVVDVSTAGGATPGQVGLWVPATGEAYFDELAIDVLPAAGPALAVLGGAS